MVDCTSLLAVAYRRLLIGDVWLTYGTVGAVYDRPRSRNLLYCGRSQTAPTVRTRRSATFCAKLRSPNANEGGPIIRMGMIPLHLDNGGSQAFPMTSAGGEVRIEGQHH